MKFSLQWVFDHINEPIDSINVKKLFDKFGTTTAEIEGVEEISCSAQNIFCGVIVAAQEDVFLVYVKELDKTIGLPVRNDLFLEEDGTYFLEKTRDGFSWATWKTFGGNRDLLFPPTQIRKFLFENDWRRFVQLPDFIIDIDNKSLTHRPDMWGHRGFAREFAALGNLSLQSKQQLCVDLEMQEHGDFLEKKSDFPASISIEDPKACKRFIAGYIPGIGNKTSDFFKALRFVRLGIKPINQLVDLTNYVMFDWGQPLHMYDGSVFSHQEISVRKAYNKEKITLLDSTDVTLIGNDLVIASKDKPLCLAGIKGGLAAQVSLQTTEFFLEAATFDATTIRRTAQRYGIRTDSSMRFEKTLSTSLPQEGLERFFWLAQDEKLLLPEIITLQALGRAQGVQTIPISHQFLENRLGGPLLQDFVTKTLCALDCTVLVQHDEQGDSIYQVKIPHARAAKDLKTVEDLFEEIVRFYGFENIKPALPAFVPRVASFSSVFNQRMIKHTMAEKFGFREQRNYAYLDEDIINALSLPVGSAITIKNPVSQCARYLAYSIIPGLLKNIVDNAIEYDELRFFEFARTWNFSEDKQIKEKKVFGGVVFVKRNQVDFMFLQQLLDDVLRLFGCKKIIFKPQDHYEDEDQIFDSQSVAFIECDGSIVGTIGYIAQKNIHRLGLEDSELVAFELCYDSFSEKSLSIPVLKGMPRYQVNTLDVSIMLPVEKAFTDVEELIYRVDSRIWKIVMIDRFSKKEWQGAQSLCLRVWIVDSEKTMMHDELKSIQEGLCDSLERFGVTIR